MPSARWRAPWPSRTIGTERRVLVAPEKVVTVNQLHVETHTATDTERLVKAGVRLWLSAESSAP
jgi:hypothetical protein